MWLTLPAVAAHQPPVCVLPARILFDDALAQVCGGRVSPGSEVEVAEPPERVEVREAQTFTDQRRPVVIRVVPKEVAAVEAGGEFVRGRRLVGLAHVLMAPAPVDQLVELLDIQPEADVRVQTV